VLLRGQDAEGAEGEEAEADASMEDEKVRDKPHSHLFQLVPAHLYHGMGTLRAWEVFPWDTTPCGPYKTSTTAKQTRTLPAWLWGTMG